MVSVYYPVTEASKVSSAAADAQMHCSAHGVGSGQKSSARSLGVALAVRPVPEEASNGGGSSGGLRSSDRGPRGGSERRDGVLVGPEDNQRLETGVRRRSAWVGIPQTRARLRTLEPPQNFVASPEQGMVPVPDKKAGCQRCCPVKLARAC